MTKESASAPEAGRASHPEPLVIPRDEHPISRKNIDREALKVLYRLRDAGHTAYLVGGGVRDLYLGKSPKDFDISTDARPGQLRKLFRNSRVIGRRFRLVQVFFHGGKIVEVSTFRCRSEYDLNGSAQVLASNNTFGSPAEDAFRRDLTINALFYEIENFTIIDYVGGVEDLNNRIIRMVGDPDRRITRDPVRILRAIRHAARSGFAIEEKTWEAIGRHRQELHLCPVSRIRDEVFKDLRGGASQAWARLAIDSGVFVVLFPFYEPCLTGPGSQAVAEELCVLLGVVDRLHGEGQQISEQMLLALFLLPWARAEMELDAEERQGEAAFAYSRQLRDRLDEILAHLNIKRATKEAITGLLVNLSLFERCAKAKNWPKWLQRKSYFREGRLFHQICAEATGGESVAAVGPLPPSQPAAKSRKRSGRPRHRMPAFAKGKGGVFGFKR